MIASMHTPAASALVAAQTHSPASTSSRVIGAFTIASQAFCTCMREYAENSDSKVAAYIVVAAMKPAARDANKLPPPTSPSTRGGRAHAAPKPSGGGGAASGRVWVVRPPPPAPRL